MALVELTGAESGQTIRVRPGDEIVLRLRENPTTGFRWQVETAAPFVVEIADNFELDAQPQIGSGGSREWRFQVTSSQGVGRLALKHWQSWEGDASISDRFSVELEAES
jgi:inhibitor of cysteine peptidase